MLTDMKLLQRNIVMAFLLLLTLCLFVFLIHGQWDYAIKPFFSLKIWHFIISGEFLQGRFDIRQAGTCLDQPTIGKYLYWFSMTSFLSSASLVLLRFRLSSSSFWQQGVFILFAAISTLFALLLLSVPTCLFLHYVTSMGMTTKRLLGLLLSAGACIILPWFAFAVSRKEWKKSWLFVIASWGALIITLLFPSYLMLSELYCQIRSGHAIDYWDLPSLIFFCVWLGFCILAVYLCRFAYIGRTRG